MNWKIMYQCGICEDEEKIGPFNSQDESVAWAESQPSRYCRTEDCGSLMGWFEDTID